MGIPVNMKFATPLGNAVAAVVISGALPASAPLATYRHCDGARTIDDVHPNVCNLPRSFDLSNPLSADYRDSEEIPSGTPDFYAFAPGRGLGNVVAIPHETGADTTPQTRSRIAGPVALAAIGALLVGGGLVILSRRLPKDTEGERLDRTEGTQGDATGEPRP